MAEQWDGGMSIITDALKKAESERELKAKHVSESEASSATTLTEEEIFPQFPKSILFPEIKVEDEKPIPRIKQSFGKYNPPWKHPAFILTAVFFLLGLLILQFLPKKTVLIVRSDKDGNIQKQISRSISSSITFNSPKLPYVLSGISKLGNSQYAIINGVIIQQGESINGAYVREILNDEVTLETQAGEIRLKIS